MDILKLDAVVKMKSLILLSPQHFLQMYHSVVLGPLPSPKNIYIQFHFEMRVQ